MAIKKMEADIAAGWAYSLFRKSPASGKAEEQPIAASAVTFSIVSIASIGERQLSGNENFVGWKILTT